MEGGASLRDSEDTDAGEGLDEGLGEDSNEGDAGCEWVSEGEAAAILNHIDEID
eukprot:CAMPEP_0197232892 /NCGR_PEP_ID=MMETSP1429-20130617/1100_1 /TAXON_ID=49237 /ORGANISM="Chaetoceros  sp., Strain UNC1202" /LENGTH=53 /DNA_ID=CAMNT_0042691033 /DNA_START=45 /DNA_END=206 /DNA_ORIENTATION=-